MKKFKHIAGITLLLALTGGGIWLNSLLPIITGYAAKNLASAVFVSGREAKEVEALDLNFSFIRYTGNTVDSVNKTVTSRFLWASSTAAWREGYGVTLLRGATADELRAQKYPLQIQKQPKEKIREAVGKVLETVHLSQYAERLPNQLSGGQQQRVALARALVAEPRLLLLDEPLSNLDAKLRESMRFEIKEIQQRTGITVVYVTHDQTEAMAMSDRIFLINRGVVQQCGTPQDIYNRPANQFVADFLGKVDFFKGEVRDGRIVFPVMGGQSLPYDGERTGKVEAAIRPENIFFAEDGPLSGVMETVYYLGDVCDCRVRVGEALVRVITGGWQEESLRKGQPVRLQVRDFMVFPDDGLLEQMLTIQT